MKYILLIILGMSFATGRYPFDPSLVIIKKTEL